MGGCVGGWLGVFSRSLAGTVVSAPALHGHEEQGKVCDDGYAIFRLCADCKIVVDCSPGRKGSPHWDDFSPQRIIMR